jgi:uncharacterized protein (DUF362 family)
MYPQFFSKNFERRTFLKSIAFASIGGLVLTNCKKDDSSDEKKTERVYTKSKVITIKDTKAGKDENSKLRYPVNADVARKMVDDGIVALTGISNLGDAWKSIFPSVSQSTKICIKVNCIASGGGPYVTADRNGLSSHPEVAYAVANSLATMQIDGNSFPLDNITIFDRADIEMKNAGYVINRNEAGIKCYGTIGSVSSGSTANCGKTSYAVNGSAQHFSNIFEQNDYMINLSVLKDHSFAGVTLSMKNNYGVVHMPECEQMHSCEAAVPLLNNLEPLKNKQVLCIVDAIYGIKSGGPEGYPQISPNSLILSKDTVAIDTIGSKMLVEFGMMSGKIPGYIKTADVRYAIGNNNMDYIDHVKIDNSDINVI